jgi:hypothetical protein
MGVVFIVFSHPLSLEKSQNLPFFLMANCAAFGCLNAERGLRRRFEFNFGSARRMDSDTLSRAFAMTVSCARTSRACLRKAGHRDDRIARRGPETPMSARSFQHQASRWMCVATGMTHPKFLFTLEPLAPEQRARVGADFCRAVTDPKKARRQLYVKKGSRADPAAFVGHVVP